MIAKNEISKLVENYFHWVKDKTILKEVEDKWIEITTPYLDRHNDCLQIYVKKDNHTYLLTDDGYIIDDLLMSGCTLNSPKRQTLIKTILAGFGVQLEGKELFVRASTKDFSLKKHNLVQAMLAINDLFYLASPTILNTFFTEVHHWMDMIGIRYTPNIKFAGKSGYDHHFDFVIPKSNVQPERILQIINNPKKNTIETLIFKWIDTHEMRPPESKIFALLNNVHTPISQTLLDALRHYDIAPLLWTQHEEARAILIA